MIENIKQMRKRHEEERAKLQKLCSHTKHYHSRFMWAPGHFGKDVEVCDNCGKILTQYDDTTPIDKNI